MERNKTYSRLMARAMMAFTAKCLQIYPASRAISAGNGFVHGMPDRYDIPFEAVRDAQQDGWQDIMVYVGYHFWVSAKDSAERNKLDPYWGVYHKTYNTNKQKAIETLIKYADGK
jgi:hypothetical protein